MLWQVLSVSSPVNESMYQHGSAYTPVHIIVAAAAMSLHDKATGEPSNLQLQKPFMLVAHRSTVPFTVSLQAVCGGGC